MQQPFEWKWPALGFVFVAVGLVMRNSERSLTGKAKKAKTSLFTRFFLGFSIFWTVVATGGMAFNYWSVRYDIDHGRYRAVEGVVENFDPMPYEGHKDESFTVRGQRFSYSDYKITRYFRQTASHGGPIRDGLQVRILHFGGGILRLEVEHGSVATPALTPGVVSPSAERQAPEPWVVVLMIVVGFPSVTGVLAFLGGWRRLAERFPATRTIDGDGYPSQSVRLSLLGSYNRCVNVTVSEAGIHLVPMILFRLFHPPILIPWNVITACRRRDFFLMKRVQITFGPLRDAIDLSGKVAPAIESFWQARNLRVDVIHA